MLAFLLNAFFFIGHTTDNYTFPPRLTEEEEAYYLDKYQNGTDEEKRDAKNILIERNLRLVAFIVNKYAFKDTEDLISVRAIKLYYRTKGLNTAFFIPTWYIFRIFISTNNIF